MNTRPRITDSRQLQTPVRSYRHPGTGRRITVVTTCHIGEPAHYQQLHATIAACTRAGAIVHCEGSDRIQPADNELTATERDTITERDRVRDVTASLVAGLGWTDQSTAFADQVDLGWQFIDLPTIEIIRRMGTDKTLTRFRAEAQFLSRAACHLPTAHLLRIKIAAALRLATRQKHRPRPAGHPYTVLIVERNRVALEAAHATDRDLVLLWGAAHLHGFDADFTSRGYLCDREDWHTVLAIPSITGSATRMLLNRLPATPPATTPPSPSHRPSEHSRS